jgi:hypothetical protein
MAIRNILRTFVKFNDHFVLIWYIFPVLVSRTNKNLATLVWSCKVPELLLGACGVGFMNRFPPEFTDKP